MKYWILIFGIIFLNSCTSVEEDLLLGDWQASEIMEEGTPLSVNTTEIQLSFNGDDFYLFNSTLNYKEAGSYFIDSKYLFTTDTVNHASTEKAVEIIKLTPDSLILKMNDSGKERLLRLTKMK